MTKYPAGPQIKDNEFTVIWAASILPGKAEAWRRFVQELVGSQRQSYEDSCRRLGIRATRVWITETARGDVGVLAVIAHQPQEVMARLAASDAPFDRWLRAQLATLQGVDITLPPVRLPAELLLDWQEQQRLKKGGLG